MNNRRQMTPEERAKKKETDKRHRDKKRAEFQRLKESEAKLMALLQEQREANRQLIEENERLNRQASDLMNQIREQRQENQRYQEKMKEVDSSTVFEYGQSSNQRVANTQGSQGAVMYADELVEDFIPKLDAKEKSDVNYSDFNGLMEELGTNGPDKLPPSLAGYDTSIKEMFGDIAANSRLNRCTSMPSHILFCAAVREMDKLTLLDIDERKILLWRDAINSALNINFQVDFAITHLKKIARAFFGLKAWNDLLHDPELNSIEGKIADLQAMYAQKIGEWNSSSEVRKQCVHEAMYFDGKFLSTGLLPEHPSS